ncbi:Hypothetical protein GbCGDNIH6_0633 [Granulibacter bethesdensis]|uniref:succinylglutamate desuccinylase/aspartoacylase domain-containing protein n=1 Tax=Granulibacter bethesdensis TaxID=364410 RepID=UPI00090C771A|nr:succinylglutamate desuccinylase/aspartoacylase family protein [Granulibacter bethesdensis]APH56438.1 Hypothetical protein GbCGDNIH6_0633 [Granulibacter bethesdensis]
MMQTTSAMIPELTVRLETPDLDPWITGNTSIQGFTSITGPRPGPHVVLVALTHGNEIAGAIVLDQLLRQGIRPLQGRLTFGFANLAAFARFDPRQPIASRFVDEDLNRVWQNDLLETSPVASDARRKEAYELCRAREIKPLIDTADVLIDLHSMLWPSRPLILCGRNRQGLELGRRAGDPALPIADDGHASGRRLIDYRPFSEIGTNRTALLIEGGQHWHSETVATLHKIVLNLLAALGMIPPQQKPPSLTPCWSVTHTIMAQTGHFTFTQPFTGGYTVPHAGTLIAHDGDKTVRTPYDDCLLVMPSLRASAGHTAVRLAKRIDIEIS